jgi:uncharacterized protein YodC (DUF2158 family)
MFDTRGKPGFHKFPLRIGDDVTLHGGGQVMTVVDFDETGEVTVAWRCGKGKIAQMISPHTSFVLMGDVV